MKVQRRINAGKEGIGGVYIYKGWDSTLHTETRGPGKDAEDLIYTLHT